MYKFVQNGLFTYLCFANCELEGNLAGISPNLDIILQDKLIAFPKTSSWDTSSLCAPKPHHHALFIQPETQDTEKRRP